MGKSGSWNHIKQRRKKKKYEQLLNASLNISLILFFRFATNIFLMVKTKGIKCLLKCALDVQMYEYDYEYAVLSW